MTTRYTIIVAIAFALTVSIACKPKRSTPPPAPEITADAVIQEDSVPSVDVKKTTVWPRKVGEIVPPDGFTRGNSSGFGSYLRSLPLKPEGSTVYLYDGTEKYWQGGAYAVIDTEIGNVDLQQCADAVIRLRAEYLWGQKRYSDIHFNFTNGFNAEYSKWAEGYHISINGNHASWYKATEPDYSYKNFRKYLYKVFSFAGTASLSRELISVPISRARIGDVFILGGHPGHAMIIVDMAEDGKGHKAILVAQSYMPAQDIHVVTNLRDESNSPWYIFDESVESFRFPEWSFDASQLKRFRD